jgi:hypothetical protein
MDEKTARSVYFCFLLTLHSPSVLKLDTTASSETSASLYQNLRRYMEDCNFQISWILLPQSLPDILSTSVSDWIKAVNLKGNETCLDLFSIPSNNSRLMYAEQEVCCDGNPTPIVSSISPLAGILQLDVLKGSQEKRSHYDLMFLWPCIII